MNTEVKKKYYLSMMNMLYGIRDDFDANLVPQDATVALDEIIEICKSDFNVRFGSEGVE